MIRKDSCRYPKGRDALCFAERGRFVVIRTLTVDASGMQAFFFARPKHARPSSPLNALSCLKIPLRATIFGSWRQKNFLRGASPRRSRSPLRASTLALGCFLVFRLSFIGVSIPFSGFSDCPPPPLNSSADQGDNFPIRQEVVDDDL